MAQFSYTIVFVSDMSRSIVFYRDVLGLPLRFESPEWTEFETPGITLALHLADGPTVSSQGRVAAGQCQLGFNVEDLDAFHQAMLAKGITCVQPPEDEDFGGKLALYNDPDGLAFAVSDFPKGASSGAEQ